MLPKNGTGAVQEEGTKVADGDMIHITVGERCYVYTPAKAFMIKVKNHKQNLELGPASSPYAIYIEGAMHVEYQGVNYLLNDETPFTYITELTTAELEEEERLLIITPMGRRMRMDRLDRMAEGASSHKRRKLDPLQLLADRDARHIQMRRFVSDVLRHTGDALPAVRQLKYVDGQVPGGSFQDPHAPLIDAENALNGMRQYAEIVAQVSDRAWKGRESRLRPRS